MFYGTLTIIAILLDEEKKDFKKENTKRKFSVHLIWQNRNKKKEINIYKELIDDEQKLKSFKWFSIVITLYIIKIKLYSFMHREACCDSVQILREIGKISEATRRKKGEKTS